MRLSVHPARKAANDDDPHRGELPPQHPCNLGAVGRAGSRAHDGRRRPPQRLGSGCAAEEEAWWRIVDRAEQRGEVGVGATQPVNAVLAQAAEVSGLVERLEERPVRAVARHVHDVGIAGRGEDRERQVAHRALSSVGDGSESASARWSAPYGRLARERRDRLRDPPCPGPAPSGKRQPLDCAIEELGRLLRPVGPSGFQLLPSHADAETHGPRLFARRSSELRGPWPRHRDHQVEPVEESPETSVP